MSRRRIRSATYRERRAVRHAIRQAPAFLGPFGGTFTYNGDTVTDAQLAAYGLKRTNGEQSRASK